MRVVWLEVTTGRSAPLELDSDALTPRELEVLVLLAEGGVEQDDRAAARDFGPYGQVSRRFGHRKARRDRPHRCGGACRSIRHHQSLSGMPNFDRKASGYFVERP